MCLVQKANGKVCIVFSSTVKTSPVEDLVYSLDISSKFMSGLSHFATQPTLDEILNEKKPRQIVNNSQ